MHKILTSMLSGNILWDLMLRSGQDSLVTVPAVLREASGLRNTTCNPSIKQNTLAMPQVDLQDSWMEAKRTTVDTDEFLAGQRLHSKLRIDKEDSKFHMAGPGVYGIEKKIAGSATPNYTQDRIA